MPEVPEGRDLDTETGEIAPPRQSFCDWLSEHRNGLCDIECAEALAEVLEGVAMTGKDGAITITLKIGMKPDAVLVTDVVTAKVPTVAEPRIYFRGLDGGLSRDNPLQPSMLKPNEGK